MKLKYLKRSISTLFLVTTIFIPANSVLAESSLPSYTASQTVDTKDLTGYDAVKDIARKKATILTTIYGNTSVEYALIDNGKIEVSGQAGVYSKTENVALTASHMYGIGSISKVFTAAAVMNLIEEGKIQLDVPVTSYINDFMMDDDRYREITVRMLLNHSSGLMGSTLQNATLLGDTDTYAHDNFLKQLSTQRLKADPGTFSVYSNDGFTLAEILIERVSGISYTKYIADNFSKSLNLNNTKTPNDEFSRDQLAKVYFPGFIKAIPADSFNAIGAGGIYSTAEDLCRFSQIFMRNSNGILTESTLNAMENKEYLRGMWTEDGDSSLSYGLGWDSVNTYPFTQYGIKALSKGGDTLLYHGNLIVLPEYNMAVAVLTSSGASTYNQVVGQEILLAALKEKGIINKIMEDKSFSAPIETSVPDALKEYEGIYGTLQGILEVSFDENDKLVVANPFLAEYSPQKFTYTGNGTFVIASGKNYTDIKFVKEKNGNIYIQNKNYTSIPGLGQIACIFYMAQKLPENKVDSDINNAWLKRNNKKYFILNEKYTSQSFANSSVISKLNMLEEVPGYFINSTIIDKNTSKTLLQIPVMHGRDLIDYTVVIKDRKEYLKAGSYLLIAENSLETLSTKKTAAYTLGKDGYAKWYKISIKSAGKKISIKSSKQSSFAVYDKEGSCINYFYLSGKSKVVLPKGGYIVFAGKASSKFVVNY